MGNDYLASDASGVNPDFVTILTDCDGRRMTKRWRAGATTPDDYDNGWEFAFEQRPIRNLDDLCAVLARLMSTQCLVLGRLKDDADPRRSRRLSRDQADGTRATLEDARHYWLPLDIENIEAVDADGEFDPIAEPERAVACVTARLPWALQDADCIWQQTSSAGMKPGIRMRLYFWLDRPLTAAEIKAWLGPYLVTQKNPDGFVDGSIYSPEHAIYAAPPIFEGAPDPVGPSRRIGMRRGAFGSAEVPTDLRSVAAKDETKHTTPPDTKLDTSERVQKAMAYLAKIFAEQGPWGEEDKPDTFVIAAWIKDIGVSEAKAFQLMSAPLAVKEMPWIKTTVHNAYTYGTNDPGCGEPGSPERKYGVPKTAAETFAEALRKLPAEPGAGGEPVDIFGDLTPEPRLTRNMLPPVIAAFAFDAAERLGVEPAMTAIPAIVFCASAIPDWVQLQPRARDTSWKTSARLWVAMIAEPGGRKTPAINTAKGPLAAVEQEWRHEDNRKIAAYETEKEFRKKAAPSMPIGDAWPAKPPARRLIVGDTTTEQLAYILAENERGVLMVHDELSGLIGALDAYRSSGVNKDRPAYLEGWNGGRRPIDRVRGSIDVPNWGFSIIGGIQPDKLRAMARENRMSDDGFLQRFLLFNGSTLGVGPDRDPDIAAAGHYAAVVRLLTGLGRCPVMRLSDGARPYWQEIEKLADAMRHLPTISLALKGHLQKVPENFARLLLTLHAIEQAARCNGVFNGLAPEVSAATAARAYNLMVHFFLPQAMRVYADMFHSEDSELGRVARVARAVLVHDGERITDRDVYRACRELRGDQWAYERQRIMKALVASRWLAPIDPPSPTAWRINPLLAERFAAQREAERQQRAQTRQRMDEAFETRRQAYNADPVDVPDEEPISEEAMGYEDVVY